MSLLSNVLKHTKVCEDKFYSYLNEPHSLHSKEHFEPEKGEVANAKYQAIKLISAAREEAQAIKKAAEILVKQEIEQAVKESYEKGFALGKEEARVEIEELLSEAVGFLGALKEQKDQLISENEDLIKNIALAVAKKIISTELQTNDTAFISLYRNALQDFISDEWVKITVSDSEYEFATEHSNLLLSMVKGAKYIEIKKMPAAPEGTCIVETSSGIADASVNTQLSLIAAAFAKAELQQNMH